MHHFNPAVLEQLSASRSYYDQSIRHLSIVFVSKACSVLVLLYPSNCCLQTELSISSALGGVPTELEMRHKVYTTACSNRSAYVLGVLAGQDLTLSEV
ncbi:hypothetical protein PoB_006167100 [Plakobranchus ocellatus]|uniref:Uncharacterized protein n=1 Tax=Plakobranchus ocellatus TaxID=259542 RepID=A0AAV4CTH0_9GAST|nr:hypothetical protein PoB_006167100 [Plakobranchus ocellatus]